MGKFKFTAKFIHESMRSRFCPPEWIYATEFHLMSGWTLNNVVDSVAFNLYPSGKHGHLLMVFEVKVSRSDFKAELKKPWKRMDAVKLADEFYFVAPKNMLKPDEIPHDSGLFEVAEDGTVRKRVSPPKPPWNAKRSNMLPRGIMAAIMRKMDPEHARQRCRQEHLREITDLKHQLDNRNYQLKQLFRTLTVP